MWIIHSLLALALVILFVRHLERSLIYRPSRHHQAKPEDLGLDAEECLFTAADGTRLHGWWFPAPDARGTVMVCHGNAGNISSRLWMVKPLHAMGCNVFLFDYRGYGRSKGRPSERGLQRDARAAFEVVRAKYGDAEHPPVLVYGISLGGAVALQLALDRPVRGLVLQSTFTTILEMSSRLYPGLPARYLCRDRYDSIHKIPALTCPVLIAHGDADDLIPDEMGRALYDAAPEPKTFVLFAGEHAEQVWDARPDYAEQFRDFVDRVFSPAACENAVDS